MEEIVEPKSTPDQHQDESEDEALHRVHIRLHVLLQHDLELDRNIRRFTKLASIHFVGRPKPWEVEPGSYRPGRGAPDATLTRRWHDSCGGEAAARSPTS